MGSECNPQSKRSYDISKSKRTRKAPFCDQKEEEDIHFFIEGGSGKHQEKHNIHVVTQGEGDHGYRKSLKQLMIINGSTNEEIMKGRSSLGQHFEEEEEEQQQLQMMMVRKEQHGFIKGRGVMGRYFKMLSHFIKVKRDYPVRKNNKPLLRLSI